MAGVYQIYNKETNKRYIGSSINIERRLKEHKRNLKANRHSNQHLQNAWNKYQEYLIFEALEYCEPDQCLKLEQEYIDYYNSANREFGYNIDPQAASAGKHLSEETKQKISKAHTGKKIPPEIVEKVRKANTGKPKPKQSEAMKRKYKNGYTIPRFTDVSADKQMIWKSHLSEGQIKRYSDYSNRPEGVSLEVLFMDGRIEEYPSMREAARRLGIDKGAIKYALDNTGGFMKKLDCYFIKVVGQK